MIIESKGKLERELWPDTVRAVATVAVVLLHVAFPYVIVTPSKQSMLAWWAGNYYDGISRFCVPVFFMLSGALLLNKDYTLKEFFNRRFYKIIPPLVFWSIIYVIYDSVYMGMVSFFSLQFLKNVIKGILNGSHFHFWFMYTLIGLYLLIPILRKWIKAAKKPEVIYFIIIWLVTIVYTSATIKTFLPKIELVNFTGFAGYLVLGYFLSKYDLKGKNIPIAILLIFIGGGITILGTYYTSVNSGQFDSSFYGLLTPNVILLSSGVFMFFKSIDIKNKSIANTIRFISNHSFGIYFVHMLSIYFLRQTNIASFISIGPVIDIPIVACLAVAISASVIYLLRKIKPLRQFVG